MSFQLHPSSVRMAERLKNPQLINGVAFDGTEPVDFYAVTHTPPATQEKVIEINNYEPRVGAQIAVKFPDGNVAQNPTLNVNGYGPIPIQYCGQPLRVDAIKPEHTYTLAYDGSAYQIISGYTDTPEVRQLITDLDEKQTKALEQAKKDLNAKIDANDEKQTTNLNQAKEELNKRIDELEVKHDNDMNNLRTDLTQKIEETRLELDTKIENYNTALNKRIDDLAADTTSKINNLKETLTNTIKTLETKHDKDISDLQNKHNQDITNLTTYINTQDKNLQDQINANKKTETDHYNEVIQKIKDVNNVIVNGPNSNDKLKALIDALAANTYNKTQTLNIVKNSRNMIKLINATQSRTVNVTMTNPTNVDGNTVTDATNNSELGAVFNTSSGKVITLPKAPNGFHVYVRANGGTVTVQGNGCKIDNNNTKITLSNLMCVMLVSDGTNYYTMDTSARFQ